MDPAPVRAVIAEFANSRLYRNYLLDRGSDWGEGVRFWSVPTDQKIPYDMGGGRAYTVARSAPHSSHAVEPGSAI